MLPFCLFVCHVRALCSNGRRYLHDFFGIRQPHVFFQIALKFCLLRSNAFSTKFCKKWAMHTCWFERRRLLVANCGRRDRIWICIHRTYIFETYPIFAQKRSRRFGTASRRVWNNDDNKQSFLGQNREVTSTLHFSVPPFWLPWPVTHPSRD